MEESPDYCQMSRKHPNPLQGGEEGPTFLHAFYKCKEIVKTDL
jgi:hypothetical protein